MATIKVVQPQLKNYLDKELTVKMNGNRQVRGVLRGFDHFMNLVLDQAFEEVSADERNELGMVVVRGNSVVTFEPVELV